jgi:CRISPR-associated protein Cmr4
VAEQILQLLHCLTPLHNGSGTGLGVVDRPILRETFTGYPIVLASTIKGALRAATGLDEEDPLVAALFGAGGTRGNVGCLNITDAMVVAFPVPSLAGTFAWATSPLQLARLHRLLQLAGDVNASAVVELVAATGDLEQGAVMVCPSLELPGSDRPTNGDGDGLTLGAGTTGGDRRAICLEGWVLDTIVTSAVLGRVATVLAGWLFAGSAYWQRLFLERLVVVHEQVYGHLVQHATEVQANIAIEASGVTSTGSLRYTEYLPAETVLATLLSLDKPRKPTGGDAATDVGIDDVRGLLEGVIGTIRRSGDDDERKPVHLQLGADETTGKGLVHSLPVALGGGA